jgi:hypothetical protein
MHNDTAMKTELKIDFTMWRKPVYFLAGIFVALVFLGFSTAYYQSHDRDFLVLGIVFCASIMLVAVFFVRWGLRWAIRKRETDTKWLLTDGGLERVYAAEKRETIRWEQIQEMRYIRYLGLLIWWQESMPDSRIEEFQDELQIKMDGRGRYRCGLCIGEDEGRELISIWQKKKVG